MSRGRDRHDEQRALGTALAASVSAWAKVNWASNEPAGQAVDAVELAGVGDPLVDQDQARRVAARSRSTRPSPGLVPVRSASATSS